MKKGQRYIALLLRAFFLCASMLLLANTPVPATNDQRIVANIQSSRPFQALYQIEDTAGRYGWTFDLALQAGDLSHSLNQIDWAVAYWELALKFDPSRVTLARHLAQGYIDLQQWSQANVVLDRVVELSDDNWAHFQLGLIQAAVNPTMAIKHLQAAARDPQFLSLYNELLPILNKSPLDTSSIIHVGGILATHDHWDYAETVFLYATTFIQSFPEAFAYAAIARDHQGKNGRQLIDRAIADAPENAQVNYLRGLHLRLVGDSEQELLAFQKAVVLDQTNPAFAAELAVSYQKLGNALLAEYWYKAAVTLSGNDQRFQKLLDDFYSQTPVTAN